MSGTHAADRLRKDRATRAAGPADIIASRRDADGNRTHFDPVASGCLAVWLQRQESQPGIELRTPRWDRGMSPFHYRGQAEGKGVEPSSPGENHVSTVARPTVSGYLPSSGPPGSRTRISSMPRWHRPVGPQAHESGEWGSNPRCPAPKAGGLPLSYPLNEWTAGELNPDFLGANQASSPIGPAARFREVRLGLEPSPPPYHGGVSPPHLQTSDPGRTRTFVSWV
jgi:hypothetical protein